MEILYFLFGMVLVGFGGWLIYNEQKPMHAVYGLFSIFLGALLCIRIINGEFNNDGYKDNYEYQDNSQRRGSNVNFEANEWNPVEVAVNDCDGNGGSLCSCKRYKGFKHAGLNRYSGNCSNYSGGHKCGHSPSDHGLPE